MTKISKDTIDDLEVMSDLTRRMEPVLFGVNLVLSILASILVIRQRRVMLNVFEDFDLQIPGLTVIMLNPVWVVVLLALGIIGVVIHFSKMTLRAKVTAQWCQLAATLVITGLFVAATVPIMQKLIEQLE